MFLSNLYLSSVILKPFIIVPTEERWLSYITDLDYVLTGRSQSLWMPWEGWRRIRYVKAFQWSLSFSSPCRGSLVFLCWWMLYVTVWNSPLININQPHGRWTLLIRYFVGMVTVCYWLRSCRVVIWWECLFPGAESLGLAPCCIML